MISVPPTSRHRYTYRDALSKAAAQPFRMVPYFDPGVWGGDWMKTHFDLPDNGSNYAWSFDGVPEENSLLLDFGSCVVETPALNLVYSLWLTNISDPEQAMDELHEQLFDPYVLIVR